MRSTGCVVCKWKTGLCEEKKIQNYGNTFLAGQADFNQHTRTQGPKPQKKPREAANLQSSQNLSISHACKTKLGCVFSFLENAIMHQSIPAAPCFVPSPRLTPANFPFFLKNGKFRWWGYLSCEMPCNCPGKGGTAGRS